MNGGMGGADGAGMPVSPGGHNGFGQGMGGMGGGMGGMMGGPSSPRRPAGNRPASARHAPADSPHVISVIPVIDEDANPESADLLEGVRNANRGNQVKQSQKLKGRYEKGGGMGMGGVGAGAAF